MNLFEDTKSIINSFFSNLFGESYPKSKNWNFLQSLILRVVHSFVETIPTLSIESGQIFSRLCKYLPFPGLDIKSTHVPGRFRDQAHIILKTYFERKYGYYPLEPNHHWSLGNLLDIQWITAKNTPSSNHRSVIYYIHGGGYAVCHSCLYNQLFGKLSEASSSQILAVDYRLGPQFTFTSIFEDILATYLYLISNKNENGTGLNSTQIVVGGDSAGGGLTANLIHFLRNIKMPQPSGAFMWSPSVDVTFSQPSMFENNPKDFLWKMNSPISLSSKGIELDSGFYWWIFNHSSPELLARMKKDGTPFGPKEATLWPEVSPMFDQDNSYLPPTLIILGERDSLRNSGIIYGKNRGKAEVEGKVNKTAIPNIQTILYEDQVHVFMAFPFNKYSTWAVKSTGEFIYQALHQNNTSALESKTYEYLPDYKKAYLSSTYNMYWQNVNGTTHPWNSTYRTIPYPTPEVFNLTTSAFIGGLGTI